MKTLLEADLLASLWYHPVVLYGVVLYVCFMVTNGLAFLGVKHVRPMKYRDGYLWGALILVVLNFIVKNVLLLGFGISMK